MANDCATTYAIVGDNKADVMRFYMDAITANGEMGSAPLGYSDWLGNIFLGAGYTKDEIEHFHTRGSDLNIRLVEKADKAGRTAVYIGADMAWEPAVDDMERMLEEKYGGKLRLYYWAEESGNEIYETNDDEGEYFEERYVIDYEDKDGNADYDYYGFGEEDELVELISRLTGRGWANVDEILANEAEMHDAFEKRNPGYNCFLSFHRFENAR